MLSVILITVDQEAIKDLQHFTIQEAVKQEGYKNVLKLNFVEAIASCTIHATGFTYLVEIFVKDEEGKCSPVRDEIM